MSLLKAIANPETIKRIQKNNKEELFTKLLKTMLEDTDTDIRERGTNSS